MPIGEPIGQGWTQLGLLALALLLSALVGLEREIRQKSAGLRTHSLVGLGAALIMLVSKYGFTDVLTPGRIALDPSRVAAQIVSGIGFIGGGLIFVRRDTVRGLTTAAAIWLTAALGMACGAGLAVLAVAVTVLYFLVVFGFPQLTRRLPSSRWTPSDLRISYADRHAVLRDVLVLCTRAGFAVSRLLVERDPRHMLDDPNQDLTAVANPGESTSVVTNGEGEPATSGYFNSPPVVMVVLEVQGTQPIADLVASLSEIRGVLSVSAGDANVPTD